MQHNAADSEPSSDISLPELLYAVAEHRPDATAVVSGAGDELSFQELVRGASELSAFLYGLGVRAGDRVGVFVEPSLDLIIGVWGSLFAGGAYVPLSPEYPEERLSYMIEESETRVILTQPELAERLSVLAPHGTAIVTIKDAEGYRGPAAVPPPPPPPPAPDQVAYVIYTSGSSGRPKGVMIEHRSIVSQMRWLAAAHGLGPARRVLQKTPASFDAAQWEILAPACGATVVTGSPGLHRDAEQLIEVIRTHGVTTLQCVPTLLRALLDTSELGTCESLTQIFSGGEALSTALARDCLDTVPWVELVNLYGPTECTINTSAFTVNRSMLGHGSGAGLSDGVAEGLSEGSHSISIGAPIPGTVYHIFDADMSEVAVGELGELHIGGVQLARGYLGRPDLTRERFIDNPFGPGKLFKTGDLARWNADGTVQFIGRADNQVKLRGFRVELDEIRLAIETHDWVKHAAVIVKHAPRTGFQNLIACVELDPREAALMDQGNHGAHHQSKESRLQVRQQLANPGVRDAAEIDGKPVIELPGKEATPAQRRQAFARKTYRFYEGGEVTASDILRLFERRVAGAAPRALSEIDRDELGRILRYFGPHFSEERLLPKYGYASPGSLYATQMYLEIAGFGAVPPGVYYFHPIRHELVLIADARNGAEPSLKVHFVGKKRAIEPVYKNNIQEVLEIETGHMVGLFEQILPSYGLDIIALEFAPGTKDRLDVADEDYYLGTFALVPYTGPRPDKDAVDIYVQVHPGKVAGLPAGLYALGTGGLERISSEIVLRKQVIAINQEVHRRASIGISVISRTDQPWLEYIDLGRTLQRLSTNDVHLGFMSAGYSSKSGNDLPSAPRINDILTKVGRPTGPSYFFVGGRVSDEQLAHEGMKEDAVHMRGPAEIIRDGLVDFLPDYMIPNKVVVFDALPTTSNGKIDVKALIASDQTDIGTDDRPFVAPRTVVERRIAELWKTALHRQTVSVHEDFFASGGNSLIAVGLINKINRSFEAALPLQILFEAATIEKLAQRVDRSDGHESSRLVPLQAQGAGKPVYCWPGLGGYPMNLRPLAERLGTDRPFFGVQAHGVNAGEIPRPTIEQMAAEDVKAIKELQPEGPYTLLGYSFGARVAFEAAYQLEQLGDEVEQVVLIAPGSPKVGPADAADHSTTYDNEAYTTILFSVFAGTIKGPLLDKCLSVAKDDESFAAFVTESFPHLDTATVRRIVRIVATTFEFSYTFREWARRRVEAPVTIVKAQGDDYSFLDGGSGGPATPPTVVELDADHYSILRVPDVDELATVVRRRLDHPREGIVMPHVNIKHFPVPLSEQQRSDLVSAVTEAVTNAFGCDEGVVSIAIEPIDQHLWNDQVYVPEIISRRHLLSKVPNYGPDTD